MALPTPRRQSRRLLTLCIVLCIMLLLLAQAGFGALSLHMSSPWYWLVGTPLSYLVIAGLGAFSMTGGLAGAQARARGSVVGVLAGSGGAAAATLVAAVIIAVLLRTPPGSPSPAAAQYAIPPRVLVTAIAVPFPAIMLVVFFVPFFLANNLLGIGLASLGGWLGGWLRASLTAREAPTGEQAGGANVPVVVTGMVLLAILVAVAAILFVSDVFRFVAVAP